MPKTHVRPPLEPDTQVVRDVAIDALRDQPHQIHRVARDHELDLYQLCLWAEKEGVETIFQPPCPRSQMILHMVNELGVRRAAHQLRLSEGAIRNLIDRCKQWWRQPPRWQPGTKIALEEEVFTVVSVYDGLHGRVLDRSGNVHDPFPWKQGKQRAKSLGMLNFTKLANRLEPYEDPRGKRPRHSVITSAMSDLGCGMKVKEVARIYGRSESTISTWASERDVKVDWLRRYHGPMPNDWERAIMRVAGEIGPSGTADVFKLSRQRIHQILRRYGDTGWREAPGWEPGERVCWAGNEFQIAAVYDADSGAVWDPDEGLIHPVHWVVHDYRVQSRWISERTIKRRLNWKVNHGKG